MKKTVSGSEKDEVVYDQFNRIVMTRNAEQRNDDEWNVIKYDELNRPILTGIYNSSVSRVTAQTNLLADCSNDVSKYCSDEFDGSASLDNYSSTTYPQTIEVNTISFYNTYDFNTDGSEDLSASIHNTKNKNIIGFPTGSKTRKLGTNSFLTSYVLFMMNMSVCIKPVKTINYIAPWQMPVK